MEGGGSEVQVHPYLHKEFQDSLGYMNETLPKKKEKEEWGNLYVVWSKFEMGNWNGPTVG